ncbi:MAG TPA: D-alanyl-D-alanine carboxypeptidase [Trebonia sp.]|nr:D-alanyl-D-alanine carboxypeptidase [Trebonia sp.]
METRIVSRRGVLGMAVAGLTTAGLAGTGLVDAPAARAAQVAGTTRARPAASPSGVRAPHAYLGDAATGADIWSRSSNVSVPMGSIAKVMTAYVVIKANTPNRVVSVPRGILGYDEAYGASTAGLVPGERLTTRDLLIAMMLPSGCDAAYTLAGAYGPGLSAFIAKMNAAARALGLSHTHFNDFSGLPVGGEYTTYSSAGNLVSLGRAALRLTLFRQVIAMRSFRLAAGSGHHAHTWDNINPLLGRYSGATGIKTGYTAAAGDCLLFSATRGKKSLIGAALHSSSSISGLGVAASDAETMLNWGFAHYR